MANSVDADVLGSAANGQDLQKRQSQALELAWLSRDRTRIARSLAATILQRSWRSYSGRKTLAYYKALIALHERSDPREILKMVNPREADMMDAAAGTTN